MELSTGLLGMWVWSPGESPVLKCRSDESAAWMVTEAKPAGRLLQKHVLREKGRHANREEK